MFFSKTAATTIALSLSGLIYAHPAPDPDPQPQATFVDAIKPWVEPLFAPGKPDFCCKEMEGCVSIKGRSENGKKYSACWFPGDAVFTADDAAAVACNINLHFVQDIRCISMKGSVCEYPGGIMRGQVSYLVPPFQISAEYSATWQAGVAEMVGKSVDYGGGRGISFCALTEEEHLCSPAIHFAGHQAPEC
ncbi:MAG: hypothetical protein Q9226_002744 [Calogaya cf. arnoldii]